MRRTAVWVGILVLTAAGLGMPTGAHAQSVSIGVQTNNLQLGVNLGPPPPLVVVPAPVAVAPGPPVYYAPNLPYNYFAYRNVYYLFRDGRWFRAHHYNGPWRAIAIAQVPRPVLTVPVEFFRDRPSRWARHGPPPWAHERERERRWGHEHRRVHDRDEGRYDHGRGRDRG
jgi:hypothetical protein